MRRFQVNASWKARVGGRVGEKLNRLLLLLNISILFVCCTQKFTILAMRCNFCSSKVFFIPQRVLFSKIAKYQLISAPKG